MINDLELNIASEQNPLSIKFQPQGAWTAISAFAIFMVLSLAVGSVVAIAAFPLGALLLGWYLYRKYPVMYASFVWWMWFVGPLIRRLIDYRCGYLTPGPWILTPTLVTAISILGLVKYLPQATKQGGRFIIIAVACCIYGFAISLVEDGFVDRGVFILLEWLAPVAFCFYLLLHWRDYPRYRQNTQKTFLWGTLVLGVYGVIQYVVAPPWERFWLESIDEYGTLSFGVPEPFGIRVSSMMDSPQSFASMMTAGLILLYSWQKSRNLWANAFGYFSFLLSLARASWLGWLVSIITLFPRLSSKLKLRLVTTMFLATLVILPVATIEPFSTTIGDRIESFQDTEGDGSLRARAIGYNQLIDLATKEFVGLGIKNPIEPDIDLDSDFIVFDNGILTLLFSLGWIGTIPYVASIVLPLIPIRATCVRQKKDLFLNATLAIIIGLLAQILLKTVNMGSMGMILWGFLGLGMSARNYYLAQSNS